MDLEPDRVVSMGTAVRARLVLGEQGVLPDPRIFVREVASHGLGIAVLKSGGHGEEDLIQAAMISRNTPIPARRIEQFYLEHEDQETVILIVLRGKDGQAMKNCLKIGELRLENLPKESKRTKRIKVNYSLDVNGIAQVACKGVGGGKRLLPVAKLRPDEPWRGSGIVSASAGTAASDGRSNGEGN